MFNAERLVLARKRRGLTGLELSRMSGVSSITISRLENGLHKPDDDSLEKLAGALHYPISFFFKEAPENITQDTASFRSLKKMTAAQRDAALAAGTLGLELYDWLDREFTLPAPDLLDLSRSVDAETAARMLRQHWRLGDRPISNVLKLVESKGVRTLSLAEATVNVDAFSFWRSEKPYIFLNTFKTAEHSIMDVAHELGHLVLHRHAGPKSTKTAEAEATRFAAAFLMPTDDVLASVPKRGISVSLILRAKFRWRVSAMALTVRLHQLGLLTDWQYRSLCIELGRKGYRSAEPSGVERERSTVWQKVLAQLWSERTTKTEIADKLALPQDEIEKLVFGLAGDVVSGRDLKGGASLKLV